MPLPEPEIDTRWWSALDALSKFRDEFYANSSAIHFLSAAIKHANSENELLYDKHEYLASLVPKKYKTPEIYLRSQLFITYISSFELFLQEILIIVLRKHPKKMGSHQIKVIDLITIDDQEDLLFKVAEDIVTKISYQKPMDYLNDICDYLSFPKTDILDDWYIFVEAKARRDIGVHSGWICNDTYLRKVHEAKIKNDFKVGDLLIPEYYPYTHNVNEATLRIADYIYNHVREKFKV